MKRGQSGLSAVLAIDKPVGLSSHDVVNRVRAMAGERRVGHAGTLDPAASGLLIVCVGPATRLSSYIMGHDKRYVAHIRFGSATNTDDEEGEVIATAPVDDEVCDPFIATDFVSGLIGEHVQVPPTFCAIKKDGKTMYKLAREGIAPQLDERPYTIYDAALVGIEMGDEPVWTLELSVSKGTYIRAIARDIGEALGTRAHLCGLRRTACGDIAIAEAVTLEELAEGGIAAHALDPLTALSLPSLAMDGPDVVAIASGKTLTAPPHLADGECALTYNGRLLAIYACENDVLVPRTVIPGGVAGVR